MIRELLQRDGLSLGRSQRHIDEAVRIAEDYLKRGLPNVFPERSGPMIFALSLGRDELYGFNKKVIGSCPVASYYHGNLRKING
jgi:hypothetical protein